MVKESWLPVAERDFEDVYEASDLGHIRRVETGRVLKPGVMPKGYRTVVLSARGVRRTVTVHKLVLEAFVGPRPKSKEARHKDGDPGNNARTNLKWGTPSENTNDKRFHGTMTVGEKNGQAKLTNEQVVEIRCRYAKGGESQRALAASYGVQQPQISRIVTGNRRQFS